MPVIAGGVEASLRRLAHYDYWSDKVRRSILLDCKADLLVYGMGEDGIVEIARRLAAGETVRDLRDMRGVAYALGSVRDAADRCAGAAQLTKQVRADKLAFAEATRLIHNETNPYNARRLVQYHDRQAVVVNPPPLPIGRRRWTGSTACRTRGGRIPATAKPIPAFEMIKDSVTIMRGCFGGCTFCSITAHQGRDHPVAQQGVGAGRSPSRWPATRSSRAWSATSAGRRPTCTRCAARGRRSRRSAGGSRACIRRSASCWAPTTARSSQLMREAREVPGHQEGARRQRHPHGPGPALARVHARAGAASRRRHLKVAPSTPIRTC